MKTKGERKIEMFWGKSLIISKNFKNLKKLMHAATSVHTCKKQI